jgi:prepilin signal peptidase PulO-like enzyme (type II secretory pathway)
MFRHRPLWLTVLIATVALMLGVYLAWSFAPGRWPYLLSSLLGLAFAGGVTWGVRLSASAGLGVEALGFGDVTLMAMIGTFVGWQPSLLVFFLAPLIAILFVVVRWAITGDPATPYGPYLCVAVVVVLVWWDRLWTNWAATLFLALGGELILSVVVACVALMGAMLWIWRLIKEATGLAGH